MLHGDYFYPRLDTCFRQSSVVIVSVIRLFVHVYTELGRPLT